MPDAKDTNKNEQISNILKTQDFRDIGDQVIQEKLDMALKQLADKDAELVRLQNQLNAGFEKTGADEALVKELEKSRLDIRALSREAELKTDRVVDLEGSLEIASREINRIRVGLESIEAAFISEQTAKNQLQNQLDMLNQRSQAAFEMADISQYLTGVINEFNDAVNIGDAAVNYIIQGLEVDMKAHIAKTDDERLLMSAPSLGSADGDALSTIRFSIAAVPKNLTE